jgi:hypothetical protein
MCGPRAVLAVALLASTAWIAPFTVHASEPDPTSSGPPTEEVEHWWGVIGAMGCGLGARLIPLDPIMIGPTIGFCLVALIDAFE